MVRLDILFSFPGERGREDYLTTKDAKEHEGGKGMEEGG